MRQVAKFPECTSRKDYDLWCAVAKTHKITVEIAGFCTDCRPEFKRKHMAAGNCSNPNIRFRVDSDGFVEGYVPGKCELARTSTAGE